MKEDSVPSESGPKASHFPIDIIGVNPTLMNYQTELKLLQEEISRLHKRKIAAEKQIDVYRKRIDETHRVEVIYVDIRRDYEQATANYQSLTNKKLQAELAENLEKSQQSEQFKIIDPAKLPDKPYKPDPQKILFLGYSLALASGFGLALLREHFDKTFLSRKEVESVLKLPVLVSIPIISTQEEQRRSMFKKAGGLFILLLMTSLLLCSLLVLKKSNPSSFYLFPF
jgi:hypothetical protein